MKALLVFFTDNCESILCVFFGKIYYEKIFVLRLKLKRKNDFIKNITFIFIFKKEYLVMHIDIYNFKGEVAC